MAGDEGGDGVGQVIDIRGRRPAGLTLADLGPDLVAALEAEGVRSIADVRSCLLTHIYPALGAVLPGELRPEQVAAALSRVEARTSRATADRAIWVLRRLWRLAADRGLADPAVDPVAAARWRRRPRPGLDRAASEVLSLGEVALLLRSPGIPLARRRLWAVLLLTGARLGEASELRVEDIQPGRPLRRLVIARAWHAKSGVIVTPKTGAIRYVPVHPALEAMLGEAAGWFAASFRRWPGPEDLLIPFRATDERRPEPRPWCSRTALKAWHRDLDLLGIAHPTAAKRREHAARHTFASLLVRGGANDVAARSLTHASKTRDARDLYVHLDWASLCDAVLKIELPRHEAPETSPQLELWPREK
jgi:integrase